MPRLSASQLFKRAGCVALFALLLALSGVFMILKAVKETRSKLENR